MEIDDVLRSHSVPFFLIQGTCLGAVRDNGFVPTERDIDLGILQENVSLIPIRSWCAMGYDVELVAAPFKAPRTIVLWKNDVKVDLVGFSEWTLTTDCMGEMSTGKRVRFAACPVRAWIDRPYCIVHYAEMLEEYVVKPMFGRSWNLPKFPNMYLRAEYGPDWITPKDDHISRTRIYDFLNMEGIPNDYLEH